MPLDPAARVSAGTGRAGISGEHAAWARGTSAALPGNSSRRLTMKNLFRTAFVVATLGASLTAFADPEVHADRQEVRADRKEILKARKELRADHKDIAQDRRDLVKDRVDVAKDRHEIAQDRKELRDDRRAGDAA